MNSFTGDKIASSISMTTLKSVGLLGEFKGRQALYSQQTPQILKALRDLAVVQSTESSNRIEGIEAPPERIKELIEEKTTPGNRPEQEIAGYRDVLQTIHSSSEHIPFTPNIVLQLHRDLYQYTGVQGGKWKAVDNDIIEERADGTQFIRFKPTPSWQTDMAMRTLHERFNEEWDAQNSAPLALISAYVLDFLCIHPFLDGNGRMSRLLTLLLLYKAGYEVGRYISLEKIVESSKESYYETLYHSSQGWHEGNHDLQPWTHYILGTFIAAYREFESRVGDLSSERGAKTAMVLEAFEKINSPFRLADLEKLCPTVGRDTIRAVLARLKAEGRAEPTGHGAGARWTRL